MSGTTQVFELLAELLALMVPGEHFETITASATPFTDENRPRAIYCGTSGTATVVDLHGNSVADVPFVAGMTVSCRFSAITAITDAKLYSLR